MGAALYIASLWLQVVELWSSGVRLVTYPELDKASKTITVFVAWSHPPVAWERGAFFLSLLYDERYPSDRTRRLKRWADSIGLSLYRWHGPEGAALLAEVPYAHREEAMRWLYAVLSSLEVGNAHLYQWAVHRYRQQQTGLRLADELSDRLRGWHFTPPTYEVLRSYFLGFLQPANLWVGTFSRLSMRDKANWRRLWASWRMPVVDTVASQVMGSLPVLVQDTVEENLWAYPIYGVAYLTTPTAWPERLAFIEAFLKRWWEIAPPLHISGGLEGPDRYYMKVRLDGKAYVYLRSLAHLAARDSEEVRAWEAAYKLARLRVHARPAQYADLWMGALLRGDSVVLPDTLPAWIGRSGWPVVLRGLWLVQDLFHLDTMMSHTASVVRSLPDSALSHVPFETLWSPRRGRAHPPLSEWAAAMQVGLANMPTRRWMLVGYYRRSREKTILLKRLHAWRRELVTKHRIPPQALQVHVQAAQPVVLPASVRVVCVGP